MYSRLRLENNQLVSIGIKQGDVARGISKQKAPPEISVRSGHTVAEKLVSELFPIVQIDV